MFTRQAQEVCTARRRTELAVKHAHSSRCLFNTAHNIKMDDSSHSVDDFS